MNLLIRRQARQTSHCELTDGSVALLDGRPERKTRRKAYRLTGQLRKVETVGGSAEHFC